MEENKTEKMLVDEMHLDLMKTVLNNILQYLEDLKVIMKSKVTLIKSSLCLIEISALKRQLYKDLNLFIISSLAFPSNSIRILSSYFRYMCEGE